MSDSLKVLIDSEPNVHNITYAYGTAGFRMANDAKQLNCALLRAALLACLRSQLHKGKAIGMMVRKTMTNKIFFFPQQI